MSTYHEYKKLRKTEAFIRWKHKQFLKQGGLCWYCEDPLWLVKVNVEHKTAMSLGGRNNKNNMVLSCSSCNKKKGSSKLSADIRTKLNKQNAKRKGTYLKNKQNYDINYGSFIDDSLVSFYKQFS